MWCLVGSKRTKVITNIRAGTSVCKYTPNVDSWSSCAPMPEKAEQFGGAVVDDTIFIGEH